MENKMYNDWHLPRLYVVLFFNALLWFSLFGFFRHDGEDAVAFMRASIVIGVTTCWMVIMHIFICRKKPLIATMVGLYFVPFVFMLLILPFTGLIPNPAGEFSPDGKYVFSAKRAANFWLLEMKNERHQPLNKWHETIPSFKHLSWEWQNETLWIYSKLDKQYFHINLDDNGIFKLKLLDSLSTLKPPQTLLETK